VLVNGIALAGTVAAVSTVAGTIGTGTAIGDCYCTALGKQAIITASSKYATISGTGYQATMTGVNA
jgi:hypothetical protein